MNFSVSGFIQQKFTSTSLRVLLFLIVIYIVVIVDWGYIVGRSDQMQLACSVYQNHPDLFKNDFFIQSLYEKFPNERTIYNYSISVWGDHSETVSLIGHILFSLILFSGIYKISSLFLKNEILRYLALLALFVSLYDINIGSCELYYNSFISSNAAKALVVWALYLFLKQKYLLSSILFSVASFYHPIAGFFPFLILCGTTLIQLLQKKIYLKSILNFTIPFAVIALPFLILEAVNYNDGIFDDTTIFNIFFKFRNAHHFIPSMFSLYGAQILLPMWLLALLFFRKKNIAIFQFLSLTILGCIIYVIGVQWVHSPLIAATQWFKHTIWIELFAVIALMAVLEIIFEHLLKKIKPNILYFSLLFLCLIFVVRILFFLNNDLKYFDFMASKQRNSEADISIMAQQNTSKDALFITPLNFTELKYYGLRSTYVDFKSPVHRKSKIIEWMKRIKFVYDIDETNKKTGFDLVAEADSNYVKNTCNKITEYKKCGITHILTYKYHKLDLRIICENDKYRIFAIP